MSVQILGMIGHRLSSETISPIGPIFDKDYIRNFAQAHENAGFDRILVGYWSDQPDGFLVTVWAGLATQRIGLLLAHRPGFVAPTLAARKLVTLDRLLDGRLALNVISGGSDAEQRKDGDFLDHDERYARTDEFLDIVKQEWTAEKPFNYKGQYYHVEQAFSAIKSEQKPHLPVFFSGASEAAIRVAAKHADVYMLWGESLDKTRELVERVRTEAAQQGRSIEFSVSLRPILGRTEEEAWAKAEQILHNARERQEQEGDLEVSLKPESIGAQRLRDTVALGERVDKRLWTGIAKLVGGGHNSTALVGTPEQVADALLDYYDLGIRYLLVRGFDPLNDAAEYGQELLPLIRAKVAARDAEAEQRRA